jgi:hypothetical protein
MQREEGRSEEGRAVFIVVETAARLGYARVA